MEIKKRKYKQSEVVEILSACKNEYERKIADKNEEINQLNAQILQLRAELVMAKDKEGAISSPAMVEIRLPKLSKVSISILQKFYRLEVIYFIPKK